jgi:hypothetical protein
MAESLMAKVVAWEKERGAKFVYDGVCMHPLHQFLYLLSCFEIWRGVAYFRVLISFLNSENDKGFCICRRDFWTCCKSTTTRGRRKNKRGRDRG